MGVGFGLDCVGVGVGMGAVVGVGGGEVGVCPGGIDVGEGVGGVFVMLTIGAVVCVGEGVTVAVLLLLHKQPLQYTEQRRKDSTKQYAVANTDFSCSITLLPVCYGTTRMMRKIS